MLSARETREFYAYCARFPIDDQSNFHYPLASFLAAFLTSKSGERRSDNSKIFSPDECLLFRAVDGDSKLPESQDNDESEIEHLIATGKW